MPAGCVFVSCMYQGTSSDCFPVPDQHSLAETERIYCAVRMKSGYTECPTRYRTLHFFNNSNTNKDIATKFERKYVLFFHISYTMR